MKELAAVESVPLEELREQVLDGLVRRFSAETLSMEELDRRTAIAAKAGTKSELLAAIDGLEAEERPTTGRPTSWRIATETPPATGSTICVFGGTERRGVWHAPRRLDAFCFFGGAEIDLRKAIVPREGITISCVAAFGGLDVIVPPDMRLEVSGTGIMGGFDHKDTDAAADAPLVRIEGFCVFGGVGIKVKSASA